MKTLLFVILSYLIGSIPFSHLFSLLTGKDVRKEGSKNVGATNALVVAGPVTGFFSLLGDVGKGYLPIFLAHHYSLPVWGVALVGLAAVVGHDFSLFLRFRGGKGVATTLGVMLALDPLLTLIIVLIWLLCLNVIRYFIPSTLVVLGLLPAILWLVGRPVPYVFWGLGVFILAMQTHWRDLELYFSGKLVPAGEAVARYLKK